MTKRAGKAEVERMAEHLWTTMLKGHIRRKTQPPAAVRFEDYYWEFELEKWKWRYLARAAIALGAKPPPARKRKE